MPQKCFLAPAVAVAALLLAACSSAEQAANPPDPKPRNVSQPANVQTGGHVTVVMRDIGFTPTTLTVSGRHLTVTAKNTGRLPHEFVLLRTNKAPRALATHGSKASESGSVGEIGEQKPGHSASHRFTLKPGRYVFICNVDGHYRAGMRGTLTVK